MLIFPEILFFFNLIQGALCVPVDFELEEVDPLAAHGNGIDPSVVRTGFRLNVNAEHQKQQKENRLIILLVAELDVIWDRGKKGFEILHNPLRIAAADMPCQTDRYPFEFILGDGGIGIQQIGVECRTNLEIREIEMVKGRAEIHKGAFDGQITGLEQKRKRLDSVNLISGERNPGDRTGQRIFKIEVLLFDELQQKRRGSGRKPVIFEFESVRKKGR